ncbi:MAG: NYN domain-containing protein [Coriobacteriia bacterium]|nr:NYN domain-containing protein [Coriobacteriia bacterium]
MARKHQKVLIVDGYNVINSSERYSKLINTDSGVSDIYIMAREALISDVAAIAQHQYDATIVFDAAHNEFSNGKTEYQAGIKIIFSPFRKEADTVIEKLAKTSGENAREVIVVTSDQATQWTVVGENVSRFSSRMFIEEICKVNQDFEDSNISYKKATIADRISPDVLAKLKLMTKQKND